MDRGSETLGGSGGRGQSSRRRRDRGRRRQEQELYRWRRELLRALPDRTSASRARPCGRAGLPDRFLLAGLCSGAFWAFETAVVDQRVQSIVMLNPRLLAFEEIRKVAANAQARAAVHTQGPAKPNSREAQAQARRSLWDPAEVSDAPDASTQARRRSHVDASRTSSRARPARPHRIFRRRTASRRVAAAREVAELEAMGARFHELPYISGTLKPLRRSERRSDPRQARR